MAFWIQYSMLDIFKKKEQKASNNLEAFLFRMILNFKIPIDNSILYFIFVITLIKLKFNKMSGIAKPLVKFSTSKTPLVPVNADFIASIEKVNVSALPNQPGNTAQWGIQVNYVTPHSVPQTVMFDTMAARDAAFTDFETLVCTTI